MDVERDNQQQLPKKKSNKNKFMDFLESSDSESEYEEKIPKKNAEKVPE